MSEQKLLNWLTWIGLIFTIISVGLQMKGVNGGFVTSYLADLSGPIWAYGIVRQRKVLFKKLLPKKADPAFSAVFVFLIGTSWEICQAFDFSGTPLAITRGRFDPWDIAAFAVSLSGCYAVDRFIFQRNESAT